MSESIGNDFGIRFGLVPLPSGGATGTPSASMPGASTIRTRSSDGSVTTAVVAGLGEIVSFTTTRPDHSLSFEA